METPDPRKQSFTQKFAGDKANLAKAMKDHEAFILRPGQKATLDNYRETVASPTPSLAAAPDLDLEARRDYQRGYIQGRWDATQSLVKQAEALWNSPPILIDAPNIDSKFLASLVPPSPAAPSEGKEKGPGEADQIPKLRMHIVTAIAPFFQGKFSDYHVYRAADAVIDAISPGEKGKEG